MKKILSIFAVTAVLASIVVTAQAQTDIISAKYGFATGAGGSTGFDFGTGVVGSASVTAGLNSAAYWNLANDNGGDGYVGATSITSSSLVDETGAATSIVASINCDGTRYNGGGPGMGFSSSSGDYYLYDGYALGNWSSDPLTLTLSGLTPGDSYSLITYIVQANLSTGSLDSGTVGSQTLYLKTMNSGGAYVSGTATASANATSGNYFEFTGITGTSSVTFTEAGSQGSSLSGFQLIQTSVPEPSTWAMMIGGFGMLLAGQRIRRSRKS